MTDRTNFHPGATQMKIIEMIRKSIAEGIADGSIRREGKLVGFSEMPKVRFPNNMFSNLRRENGNIIIDFHPERFFNDYGAGI